MRGLRASAAVIAALAVTAASAQCQIAKFSEGKPQGYYAYAVTISGERLAVTYPFETNGDYHVRIYERDGSQWLAAATLQPVPPMPDAFGASLALEGSRLIAGAPFDGTKGTAAGAVYVFAYSNSVWSQSAKLFASDSPAKPAFGHAVSLDGDRLLVTAFGDNHGRAYVFDRDPNGEWLESAKLDPVGAVGLDYYGYSCALDGDVAVVGAPSDGQFGFTSGAAYIFEREASGLWSQSIKLPAPPGQYQFISRFGASVGVWGDTVFVGGPSSDGLLPGVGAVFMYRRGPVGAWEPAGKLFASDAAPGSFAETLSIAGDILVVGAPVDDVAVTNSGSVYVFARQPDDEWIEVAKLVATDPKAYDQLGHALSVNGNIAAIGTFPNQSSSSPGAVYLYAVGPDGNANGLMDACECPGDINKDWIVDQQDLGALLAAYGTCEGDPGFNPKANLAPGPAPLCPPGVEGIDQADLGVLLGNYGAICP